MLKKYQQWSSQKLLKTITQKVSIQNENLMKRGKMEHFFKTYQYCAEAPL
jgi:hypothetical protein